MGVARDYRGRPFAVAAVAAVLVIASIVIASSTISASTPTEATVTLTEPLTARNAAEIAARSGARLVELQFEYRAGPDARGGGHFVRDASSPQRVANEFAEAVRSMLVDQITSVGAIAAKYPGDRALGAQLAGLRAAAAGFPERSVHTLRVLGDGNSLTAIANDPNVAKVLLRSQQRPPARAASAKFPGLAAVGSTHEAYSTWVPNTVHVTALDSSFAGQRYVQQTFIWNSGRSLAFSSGEGYEAQFYTDFSDGLRYFSERDGNGFPVGNTWDSNLPGRYLVTSAGDPATQLGYMVGSYDGEFIATGVWYNTYVRTPNGNASSDIAEIQPQQTVETFGFCVTTWCMKGDYTCIAGGFWNISIPVSDWVWNWSGSNC
jgi:hypothetical protein